MAKGVSKTNAMRMLERAGAEYEAREYDAETTDGVLVAGLLGEDPEDVFKTLVTEAPTKEHFVFVIPVRETLDLKKAARTAGVKSIAMLKQKDLLPLTGYVHGGCSPIGMKKTFPTFIHESAAERGRIFVSAGRRGCQIHVKTSELCRVVPASFADLIV